MKNIVIHYEVAEMTEPEEFIAYLISQYELLINNGWWFKQKPEEPVFTLAIVCNDMFAYACADCEPIAMEELETVAKLVYEHEHWGSTAWCVAKRKLRPLPSRVDQMTADGWDVEKLLTLDPKDVAQAFTLPLAGT